MLTVNRLSLSLSVVQLFQIIQLSWQIKTKSRFYATIFNEDLRNRLFYIFIFNLILTIDRPLISLSMQSFEKVYKYIYKYIFQCQVKLLY